jgi:hypothetical protein
MTGDAYCLPYTSGYQKIVVTPMVIYLECAKLEEEC